MGYSAELAIIIVIVNLAWSCVFHMTIVVIVTLSRPRQMQATAETSPSLSPSSSVVNSAEALAPTNPTTVESFPLFPVAAILVVLLITFLIVVVTLLLLRKLLKNKGVISGNCLPQCPLCCRDILSSCRPNCLEFMGKMDCSIPSCQVWLDNVCPTKQQCSMTCSRIWSCYCCLVVAGQCDNVQVCPSCSAMECPDCSCCGDCCHCTLKVPECSHVTCLCFECGKAP